MNKPFKEMSPDEQAAEKARWAKRRENGTTHKVVPAEHCPELSRCSVCGAYEAELGDYTCVEYARKVESERLAYKDGDRLPPGV